MIRISPPWWPTTWLIAVLSVVGCGGSALPASAVGTLEMVEVDVGPLQPGRALRVLVQEGDAVRTGDTLVIFTTPTVASAQAQAEARAGAAAAIAEELARGSRPAELSRADAELRALESEADRAAADLARLEPLGAKGDVSRATVDAARATARTTAARRDAAREQLRLVREGARVERRRAAALDARGAAAAADGVRAAALDLVLLAPVDGVVVSRNIEPGEVVQPGQSVVTLGEPERPWARIYVGPEVLSRLREGDSLSARLDADTAAFRGRIAAIATKAEFTPRVALTEQERADLLFAVRIDFRDPTRRLRAGLPITVELPAASK
ncbi:MAG: hypothetical protein RLZZ621_193 [Gemmatimonadota bacterium]